MIESPWNLPLPRNPDDLLARGWTETTHPAEAANARRVFVHPDTGVTVEFDYGQPGAPGWRGRDHYHIRNPHAVGKADKYLDREGQPVANGSRPSHILPDR